jgi:hypothetical protein
LALEELRAAVSHLTADELAAVAQWFEAFMADVWDRGIEKDSWAGRRAEADFESGRCKPL